MVDNNIVLLSAIVFLPVVGAIILAIPGLFRHDKPDAIRFFTLIVTAAVFAACLGLAWNFQASGEAAKAMQNAFNVSWIPSFNIYYYMGLDGISFPLIMLTAFVSLLAMGASWSVTKHVRAYCILFLLLETGMLGVFLALDFFLFYVFWEVMLLPMYFLIGVWGGPRREYAAIKFFLYTLVGSVLMLVAVLLLYFNSDLRAVAKVSDFYGDTNAAVKWDKLHLHPSVSAKLGRLPVGEASDQITLTARDSGSEQPVRVQLVRTNDFGVITEARFDKESNTVFVTVASVSDTAADVVKAIKENSDAAAVVEAALPAGSKGNEPLLADKPVHTFNLLALAAMGQHTDKFSRKLQIWCFVLLFIGFAIKVPSVPLHTWLPDAHVEAPTPISMILAGVLLKMGGYGIIRICYPICPFGGYDLAYIVCLIGVVSMVYGGFAAMAQTDFKRLVAYSSVSHMGYVVLGLGVWSATAGNPMGAFNSDFWNMGVSGAMFQMIAHGISSAGMFFLVGVVYDRVHHRNLNEFGGLFGKMPGYTAMSIGIFFAGLGLPGLCGFIGEVLVVLSVWNYAPALAVVSASVVIITAAYILWAIQRVYLGAEYKGPHEEALTPMSLREWAIALPLFVFAIVLGVAPYQTVLNYTDETITQQVESLADWTRRVPTELERQQAVEQATDREPRVDADQAVVQSPIGERPS